MDSLTTYTHGSELQAITAPPLILTIHKSPKHPLSLFPACCVFTSRSLATASNSGDSSAPRAQVLSSQPPLQNSSPNWQLTASPQLSSLKPLRTDLVENAVSNSNYSWFRISCSGNVFTDRLPRSGLHNAFVYSPIACHHLCILQYYITIGAWPTKDDRENKLSHFFLYRFRTFTS
jgi:hypothetical protein